MRGVCERVLWTPSALCPCAQGNSNEADPNHILCRGSGHIPLTAQTHLIRAMVSHFSSKYSQMDAGTALPGDIVISPLPRDPLLIGSWDMIRLPGWERGEKYPGDVVQVAATGSPKQNFLTYTPQRIEQAFSVTLPDSPSSAVVNYVSGTDFTLAGHVISWINAPAAGTWVSVKYRATMEYIVVDIPDVRYERGTDLGQRVLARKREFIPLGVTAGTTGPGSYF